MIMVVTLMIKVTNVQVYPSTALVLGELGELAALVTVLLEKYNMAFSSASELGRIGHPF